MHRRTSPTKSEDTMKHQGTVQLETERLILRRFTMDDADAMYANWASNPDVTKYLSWPPHASVEESRKVLEDWIANYERPDYYQWAIELRTLGDPVGSISVVSLVDRIGCVEIGYCIGRQWWNRGIVGEALGAIIDFFFDWTEAQRVWAKYDTRNPYSGRVMAHCGMTHEGTMRRAALCNAGVGDLGLYSILRNEWESNLSDW